MMSGKKLNDLPSSDKDFWEGEKYSATPRAIEMCSTHGRGDLSHGGFIDNHDGTVSCRFCPFGAILPGYMRVHEGRVVDLRELGN